MWEYVVGGFVAATVLPAVVKVGLPAAWRAIRPKLRGIAGESKVNRCLSKFKGKDVARARDVMIPVKGEKTSQIDNLLITTHGIFVIETKNYAGTVLGDEKAYNWLHIPPGKYANAREFYSPVRQNEGHIKALRELLKDSYPGIKFHNIVAFSNECRPPKIDGVVTFSKLRKAIKKQMKGPPVLSEKDVAAIKGIIEKNNIKDRGRRSDHVANAKYAAVMSKERERQAIVRQRAEANKESAMRIQMLYSQGLGNNSVADRRGEKTVEEKAPLFEQIQSAAGQRKGGSFVEKEPVKAPSSGRVDSSKRVSLGSQIQTADAQKKSGPSVEQVVNKDIFFEL